MADNHITRVVVENRTGRDIHGLVVVHRFGEDPSETLAWGEPLTNAATTTPKSVQFRTGFGAMTSYDWWTVTWANEEKLYTSSPSIGNYISDFLAQGASAFASMAGAAVAHVLAQSSSETAKMSTTGTTLLVAGLGVVLGTVLKRSSKAEYKEFMLKNEDEANGITITINDTDIQFTAASGSASTKFQAIPIPDDVRVEFLRQFIATA